MKTVSSRASDIEAFILQHVLEHPSDIARVTAEHFEISRQAVNRHLKRLLEEGKLVAEGVTRSRSYAPAVLASEQFELHVSPSLEEHVVWSEHVHRLLQGVPKNVLDICHHGFTEMLNNVIDHSGSQLVVVSVGRSAACIDISLFDNGIGIFRKLSRDLGLEDERHAVLELSKGKLTTDPKRHSGEGIFFTSRMFDAFKISSGSVTLFCRDGEGWLLDEKEPWLPVKDVISPVEGTHVLMRISVHSARTMTEVFDRYSDKEEDYGFTRTRVPVSLARFGDENLVSRSQAKRLLARFEKFKEVMLDFEGVDTVGQAFSDEIFRVFRNEHPEVHLTYANTVSQVEQMIRRALAAR